MALAASIAEASSTAQDNLIQTDDGAKWHRDVALMENIHLCHRSLAGEAEYAAVEYFPSHDRHEIWNRGRDAVDVVRLFAQEQRNAVQVWTEDLKAQVREFLTEKYPGRDVGWVGESFMSQSAQSVAPQKARLSVQDHGPETRI